MQPLRPLTSIQIARLLHEVFGLPVSNLPAPPFILRIVGTRRGRVIEVTLGQIEPEAVYTRIFYTKVKGRPARLAVCETDIGPHGERVLSVMVTSLHEFPLPSFVRGTGAGSGPIRWGSYLAPEVPGAKTTLRRWVSHHAVAFAPNREFGADGRDGHLLLVEKGMEPLLLTGRFLAGVPFYRVVDLPLVFKAEGLPRKLSPLEQLYYSVREDECPSGASGPRR